MAVRKPMGVTEYLLQHPAAQGMHFVQGLSSDDQPRPSKVCSIFALL